MNDLDKLRMLLPHWMEHNAEHAAEFRAWAARARAAGQQGVALDIEVAASSMEASNTALEGAAAILGRDPLHDHDHDHHHQHGAPHV